jgi:hypothetical protein
MHADSPPPPLPLLHRLTQALVCVVLWGILANYPRYIPPDFAADFLAGRQESFHGAYECAFYAHLLAGPVSLLLGLVLVDRSLRHRFPRWHMALGRVQVAVVLLLLVPSGLWMALEAEGGVVGRLGFFTLALTTGGCTALGWRAAVARRFDVHQRWMTRSFVLLCSAVVLRLVSAIATLVGPHPAWLYPSSAWTTWVVPLLINEIIGAGRADHRSRP